MARPKPPGRSLEAVSNDGSRGMIVTCATSHRSVGTEFGLPAACDLFLTVTTRAVLRSPARGLPPS